MTRNKPVNYQLLKSTEGGRWTKKEAMAEARAMGAKVSPGVAYCIGHYGLDITASKRIHRKLEKFYFG